MQGATWLLLRHGQTAWNTERRFLGRTDVPLDATGRSQAAAAARALGGVDAIWSSPLRRALETAEALEGPRPVRVHPGFAEMDMGELEGIDGPTFAARYPELLRTWRVDPSAAEIPGGETMAQVQARAVAALADIAPEARGRVVVVTHQLALSALLCALRGAPLSSFRQYTHRNTAWAVIEGGKLERWDVAPHLDPVLTAP